MGEKQNDGWMDYIRITWSLGTKWNERPPKEGKSPGDLFFMREAGETGMSKPACSRFPTRGSPILLPHTWRVATSLPKEVHEKRCLCSSPSKSRCRPERMPTVNRQLPRNTQNPHTGRLLCGSKNWGIHDEWRRRCWPPIVLWGGSIGAISIEGARAISLGGFAIKSVGGRRCLEADIGNQS